MPIREATNSDIPALAGLLAELFAQESEFKPDLERQHRGLNAIIANPGIGCILIAEDADRAIGMVNLLFTISTARGTPVALLEDMVVAKAARGMGTGSALMSAAIDKARASGCSRITLLTDHDNVAAQRFYASFGFTRSTMLPYRLMLD